MPWAVLLLQPERGDPEPFSDRFLPWLGVRGNKLQVEALQKQRDKAKALLDMIDKQLHSERGSGEVRGCGRGSGGGGDGYGGGGESSISGGGGGGESSISGGGGADGGAGGWEPQSET